MCMCRLFLKAAWCEVTDSAASWHLITSRGLKSHSPSNFISRLPVCYRVLLPLLLLFWVCFTSSVQASGMNLTLGHQWSVTLQRCKPYRRESVEPLRSHSFALYVPTTELSYIKALKDYLQSTLINHTTRSNHLVELMLYYCHQGAA